jgi:hypothetical protein
VDTVWYLASKAMPDIYGVFLTVPLILLYIAMRDRKKRFCAACQRPMNRTARNATTKTERKSDCIIIEGG